MLTAKHKLEFKTGRRTTKRIVEAGQMPQAPVRAPLPRITKMMALAIRLEHLIKTGQVSDQAELARVGHVSRARLTQIMDLNLLAPDIQEEILFLSTGGRQMERTVRPIIQEMAWSKQRELWNRQRHKEPKGN